MKLSRPLSPTVLALLAGVVVAALPAAPARAQTVLHTFPGPTTKDLFGGAVASAGDVDADGVTDVLIGASGDDTAGVDRGAAYVYSGATGAQLWHWAGEAPGDGLGESVAGVGDVNGDGHDDVLVGEYRHDGVGANSGRVLLFSGLDGSVLATIDGTGTDDEFGIGVTGVGDISGDGVPDFAIGAHHDDDNGANSGSARLVSGATGGQLHLVTGDPGDDLGHVLGCLGDIDGDDVPDFIIGLHDNFQPGHTRVYSGIDSWVLYDLAGHSNADFYGHAVSGAGDVDGDGVPDFLIGASQDDAMGNASGRAWLHSGATGEVLYEWLGGAPGDGFGSSLCSAGDWDGDGVLDVVVGIPGDDTNGNGSCAARFFSGLDGSVLTTWHGVSPGSRFAIAVANLGDVNGDTRPDVVFGLSYDDQAGDDAGTALVLSGALPTWTALGGGIPGAAGAPVLAGQGLLAAGTPGKLSLQGAAPLAPALLFVAIQSLPVPFKGGQLAAFPSVAQLALATLPDGSLVLPWASWPSGLPAGLALYFQVAVQDAGAVQGVALGNLLSGTTK